MKRPSVRCRGIGWLGMLLLLSCFPTWSHAGGTVVTWGVTNVAGLGDVPTDLTNAVALAAGGEHSIALRANGKVTVWGDNTYGQRNVPISLSNIVAIAAAWNHSLALKANGTVVAWGDLNTVPAGLTNVAAVAAGDYHNLALKGDGTVVAWGSVSSGSATNVPAGLSNVVAIAAGGTFSAAANADGTVVAWGPSVPATADFTNVAALAANEFPLVGLKADGTVTAASTGPSPVGLSHVIAVAAGRYYALALKADATIVGWGSPPALPAGLTNVQAIASGQNHCLALLGSGAPFLTTPLLNRTVAPGSTVPLYAFATGAWPLSYQWQFNGTNLPDATNIILALTNVLTSGNYSVVITNSSGAVTSSVAALTVIDFASALNTTNLDWTTKGNAPWFVETKWTQDGVSALQSGAITNNQSTMLQTIVTGPGTLTFWWKVSSPSDGVLLFKIGNSWQANISGSVSWQSKTFYLGAGPQVLQWVFSKGGNQSAGQYAGWLDQVSFTPGATVPFFTSPPVSQSQAPGFSATFSASALGTPPLTYQWQLRGADLLNATNSNLSVANVQTDNCGDYNLVVTNIAGVTNVHATLELGQIAAWGDNGYGQITVPTGMTNVMAVAVGSIHSLALKRDGTVVAWGNNGDGRANVPAELTNAVAIAGGGGAEHSLALKADGTVAVWGDNTFGQTNVPPDLTNVVAIAEGWYHSLVLKADGTVMAWGYNWYGQTSVPDDLSNVVAIAAGGYHSLALKNNGTIVAWGWNNYGQINVPADLSNAVAIAGGFFFNLAVKADGTVVAWGDNTAGQTNVSPDLSHVIGVAAGWYHSLAIQSDGMVAPCDTNSTVPLGLTNVIAVASGLFHNLALEGNAPPLLQAPSANPLLGTNGFNFSLPTQSGRVYALEYKSSLTDSRWTALPLAAGNGTTLTLTDPTATNAQRFYRVRRW